jgi:hypothetical protein
MRVLAARVFTLKRVLGFLKTVRVSAVNNKHNAVSVVVVMLPQFAETTLSKRHVRVCASCVRVRVALCTCHARGKTAGKKSARNDELVLPDFLFSGYVETIKFHFATLHRMRVERRAWLGVLVIGSFLKVANELGFALEARLARTRAN